MCERCQAARGHGANELEAAYHPGHPYLHWTCALYPYQEFWGGAVEPHKAQQHPGWTATFEILQRYLRQRLRVIYRRAADRGPGEGGGSAPS